MAKTNTLFSLIVSLVLSFFPFFSCVVVDSEAVAAANCLLLLSCRVEPSVSASSDSICRVSVPDCSDSADVDDRGRYAVDALSSSRSTT